jgi:hypothetical protein
MVILYHLESDSLTRNDDFQAAWDRHGEITEERWLDDPALWSPQEGREAAWRTLNLPPVLAMALDTGCAIVVHSRGLEAVRAKEPKDR